MRLLERYIIRCFFKAWWSSVFLFFSILFAFHLFCVLDEFIKEHIKINSALSYLLFYSPYTLIMALPISSLFATLLCMGRLSRRGELLGMYSLGQSPSRIFLAMFFCCTILAGVEFSLCEFLLPQSMEAAHNIRGRKKEEKMCISLKIGGEVFKLEGIKAEKIDYMHQVRVCGGKIKEVIYATSLIYNDGWKAQYLVKRVFYGEELKMEEFYKDILVQKIPPPKKLQILLEGIKKDANTVSARKMYSYIKHLTHYGVDAIERIVEFHTKIAFPFSIFSLSILGFSFSTHKASIGFGISTIFALIYWFFLATTKSLGAKGAINPIISAWLPNILFVTIGIVKFSWKR